MAYRISLILYMGAVLGQNKTGLHGYISLILGYMGKSYSGLHGCSLILAYMGTVLFWPTWVQSYSGLHGYCLILAYMGTVLFCTHGLHGYSLILAYMGKSYSGLHG